MPMPSFFHTPDRLIRQALKDAGRLQLGSTPSGEVLSDALNRLADIIYMLQTKGLKLWLNSIESFPTIASQKSYTFGPADDPASDKRMRVLEGWRVDATDNRTPLSGLSWNEYHNLGNLETEGPPVNYFADKQQSNLIVSLWPVPDDVYTIELLVQRQTAVPSTLSEDIGFPTEWYMALRWSLADDLATGQPALIMERAERKAKECVAILENWDVEDPSTRFAPSAQFGGRPSRFR